jgi:N-methylhydantoinase A
MALSGPAAGVIGAAEIGRRALCENVISIDIGGTSADISLIRGGQPEITTEATVGRWPVHLPMIDIKTIGAGGGSIASITATGGLIVGPRSAGAEPGPACYGRGGTDPTVTDANLILGRIPDELVDGGLRLRLDLAEASLQTLAEV